MQDRTHLTQLKDVQKREKELLLRVAQLEDENRKLTASKQSTKKLKKEFQKTFKGLTALDWLDKALALSSVEGKFTDPQKSIKYLNNAIKLQPDYANYYFFRAEAYNCLGQYQRAIEDYNETIRLQPDFAAVYNDRGAVYNKLGQSQRAIEDYNETIRLVQNDAIAYSNRGLTYAKIGQYQRAIEDYSEAIRLKPDDAGVYYSRGNASFKLKQSQQAIEDYNQAIRLKPDYADAYNNRALAYLLQGNENQNRCYFLPGHEALGCRDAQRACELGVCDSLKVFKAVGYCR